MAWLQRPTTATLAWDFAAVHDAHITQTLDASGTFLIVFREAALSTSTFTVSLALLSVPLDSGPPDAMLTDADDATVVDADLDAGNDATADVNSMVTCTYDLSLPALQACSACTLPAPTTSTTSSVPIVIDNAGGGTSDFSLDGGGGRTLHINAPNEFAAFGCTKLASLALDGVPPSESWGYSGNLSGMCGMTNATISSSITVANGSQANIDLHLSHLPGVANCGVIHGCVLAKLDCSGAASALVK